MKRQDAIISCLLVSLALACDGTETPKDADVAEVVLALTQVPAGVGCIVITATGGITVKKAFSVSAGGNPTLRLRGAPIGRVVLDAAAYGGGACPPPASAVASWVAETQTLALIPGVNQPVVLVLRKATGVDVTLDFNSSSCQPGFTLCGSACFDLASDPLHCGGCATQCSAGTACSGGFCQINCGMNRLLCGGVCVFPLSDPQNCGGCGIQCAPNATCDSGVCGQPCPPPRTTLCPKGCVDLSNDDFNCGACGVLCLGSVHCHAGTCQPD